MSSHKQVSPNVMVWVAPKASKAARVEELILSVAEEVRNHEPYISLYQYHRVKGDVSGHDPEASETEFVIVFLIDDTSRLSTRGEMPHHQAIAKAIREEDLLRTPLKYLRLEDLGFWMR